MTIEEVNGGTGAERAKKKNKAKDGEKVKDDDPVQGQIVLAQAAPRTGQPPRKVVSGRFIEARKAILRSTGESRRDWKTRVLGAARRPARGA